MELGSPDGFDSGEVRLPRRKLHQGDHGPQRAVDGEHTIRSEQVDPVGARVERALDVALGIKGTRSGR